MAEVLPELTPRSVTLRATGNCSGMKLQNVNRSAARGTPAPLYSDLTL
jgi:hypothetical protein